MTYNPDFQVTIIQRQITRKRYNIELLLQWLTNRKSYIVYRTAPCSMTFSDLFPGFKVTPFFDAEYLRNGTRYRQFQWNANMDIHTPYSTVSFRMTVSEFEWLGEILTRSVARSLCDRWASFVQVIMTHEHAHKNLYQMYHIWVC